MPGRSTLLMPSPFSLPAGKSMLEHIQLIEWVLLHTEDGVMKKSQPGWFHARPTNEPRFWLTS
jgi:hypothetical protein